MRGGDVFVAAVRPPAHDDGVVHTRNTLDAPKHGEHFPVLGGFLVLGNSQAVDGFCVYPGGAALGEELEPGREHVKLVVVARLVVAVGHRDDGDDENDQDEDEALEDDGAVKPLSGRGARFRTAGLGHTHAPAADPVASIHHTRAGKSRKHGGLPPQGQAATCGAAPRRGYHYKNPAPPRSPPRLENQPPLPPPCQGVGKGDAPSPG